MSSPGSEERLPNPLRPKNLEPHTLLPVDCLCRLRGAAPAAAAAIAPETHARSNPEKKGADYDDSEGDDGDSLCAGG